MCNSSFNLHRGVIYEQTGEQREVKLLAQGYITDKSWNWDFNVGSLKLESTALYAVLYVVSGGNGKSILMS